MNGEYIRRMSPEDFAETAEPWIKEGIGNARLDIPAISKMLQKRTETLGDIPGSIGFLVKIGKIDSDLYFHKKMKSNVESARQLLPLVRDALAEVDDWNHDSLYSVLAAAAAENEVKNGKLMWPMRVAITGLPVTPGGATDIAGILGKEETLSRISAAIEQLEEDND
jgi:glutamyl-tRNA synthetase